MNKRLRHWRTHKQRLLDLGKQGYHTRIEDLGIAPEMLAALHALKARSEIAVLADIDQDGLLLSHFGHIAGASTVSKEDFMPRQRFSLELVAIHGNVGVRKHFRGDRLAFLNEIDALHGLAGHALPIPAILDIDFDHLSITSSYILGSALREELARRGALLRDRDVKDAPSGAGPSSPNCRLTRIKEGRRVLYEVVGEHQIRDLFTLISQIHALRFTLNDIKYGNLIIETQSRTLLLIDFDSACNYGAVKPSLFRFLKDEDIEQFNLHFGTTRLTYRRIKTQVDEYNKARGDEWYAPVYFGVGLGIGPIWNLEAGYGRWRYILKRHLPEVHGKRILDLGANNGFTSLQLLRRGAREVLGVELNEKYIAQGTFVKEVFEWIDGRSYNFNYVQANMRRLPAMDLGKFDMVMALCSLYYLGEPALAQLIRHVSTITTVFVVQCNIASGIGRYNSDTYRKASIEYMVEALRCNGFRITDVIAPVGYSRPLVIASTQESPCSQE